MKYIITVAVIAALAVGFFFVQNSKVGEIVYEQKIVTEEVVVDSYEHRVESMIASTTEEWKVKHRNWAEQEVTKQLVTENEERLKTLRQEELSF